MAGIPVPLLSGAYNSPAYIAGAQRCVNLYPEQNPAEIQASGLSPLAPQIPFTHRLWPGLRRAFVFPDSTTVRGLFRASNGDLYGVCGTSVYFIDDKFTLTGLGVIQAGTTPVKFTDNGVTGVLVDGTGMGYQIDLTSHAMSPIDAENASGLNGFGFFGANAIDEMDGFIVGNQPGTANWFASNDYAIEFDALSTAAKTGRPDPIQFLVVLHRYVWLVGQLATEIWYNAGGLQFPFAVVSGPYIEHGSVAPYGYCANDESVYWITQDLRGRGVVVEGLASGYSVQRVSTHAIEQEWSTYPTLEDAVGMSFQLGGHSFAVFRFPSADKTWAYDRLTKQWMEPVSYDLDMNEHQWRVTCIANAYGMVLGGDYANGKVYVLDPEVYTEDTGPIQRKRGFPHLMNQLKRVRHSQFLLDIEVGNLQLEFHLPTQLRLDPGGLLPLLTDGLNPVPILLDPLTTLYDFGKPQVWLRYSDTRGKSWGNPVGRSLGAAGEYNSSVQWRQLGLGRDRVYEVFWTSPQATAMNGAFLEVDAGRT